jgi:NitT/TauT family transport system ATP-binding protein
VTVAMPAAMPTQTPTDHPLAVHDLTVRFGEHVALERLSLELSRGEFVVLVGPSGCGKSTLLNAISGLLSEGADVEGETALADGVRLAYAFQTDALLPWANARRNVEVGAELAGVPKGQRAATASRLLELLGLEQFEERYPHELSGGMRQRVALARVLAYDPDLILMDEPFGALDAFTRMKLQNQLLDVWRETRKTMLLVTHDLAEALILGTRVVVLSPSPGRIEEIVDNSDLSKDRRAEQMRSSDEFLERYKALWDRMMAVGAGGEGTEGPR